MSDITRVDAVEVRAQLQAGDALLVCAYESDAKFQANNLEGAMSLTEFQSLVPNLDKNKELVFYCA